MNVDVALARASAIYNQVINAVDPAKLVRRHLSLAPNALIVGGESFNLNGRSRIVALALGKAAPKMMEGALAAVGQRIDSGLIITKAGVPISEEVKQAGFPVILGGHPMPDEESLRAGEAALELVSQLGEDDILLMLISGGGSALMELQVDGITLEDFRATTRSLLRWGADINQQNAVRHRLSRIKGGKLAAAASPAKVINLIVSDVLGNPLPVIASGPTVPFDPALDAGVDALVDTPVWGLLPGAVRSQLTEPRVELNASTNNSIRSLVIADARAAAEAAAKAARELGYASNLIGVAFTGEAREFATEWVERARAARGGNDVTRPTCLVGAGELTVTVTGNGVGGRNSEMLAAAALLIDGDEHLAVASLATDGDDGTTGAAGGVVTGESCRIARDAALDVEALLDDNDTQRLLNVTGGALRPGLTGTNVNDMYLMFIDGPASERVARRETCAAPGDAT